MAMSIAARRTDGSPVNRVLGSKVNREEEKGGFSLENSSSREKPPFSVHHGSSVHHSCDRGGAA